MFHLEAGAVHIWRIPHKQEEGVIRLLWRTLAPDEQDRAERFRFVRHRSAFIVRRGALRAILAGYTGLAAAALRFVTGASGKPALAAHVHPSRTEPVRFNLSHSQDCAVCAVSCSEVGVDIERVRPLDDCDALSRQVFCPQERAELHSLAPDRRQQGFFRCWTRKEALLKGIGIGLNAPLNEVDASPDSVEHPDCTGMARTWMLQDIPTFPDYAAAVAVSGRLDRLFSRAWFASS